MKQEISNVQCRISNKEVNSHKRGREIYYFLFIIYDLGNQVFGAEMLPSLRIKRS